MEIMKRKIVVGGVTVLLIQFGMMQMSLAEDTLQSDSIDDTINSEFVAAIANRAEMTSDIIDRVREEAVKRGLEGWESELTNALDNADSEAFLAAYNARSGYSAIVSALAGISFDKVSLVHNYNAGGVADLLERPSKNGTNKLARIPDSAYKNLVYTPVTPCRILSTTESSAGKILARTSRSFYAHGTGTQMRVQGGDRRGCLSNGNRDAYGYLFNITVHRVGGGGHVRIYPAHELSTITSIVNFIPGEAVANSTIVKTSHTYGKDFKIYAATDAHVIVDVMGYFDKPERAMPDTYTVRARASISGKGLKVIHTPSCPVGYRLISGGFNSRHWQVTLADSYAYTDAIGANVNATKWRCAVENHAASSATVDCMGYCLRLPGK